MTGLLLQVYWGTLTQNWTFLFFILADTQPTSAVKKKKGPCMMHLGILVRLQFEVA